MGERFTKKLLINKLEYTWRVESCAQAGAPLFLFSYYIKTYHLFKTKSIPTNLVNITLTVTIFHKLILWSILWRYHMFSSYVFCRSLLKPIWQLYSVICFVSLYLFPNFLVTRLSVASLRGWCPYTELGLGRRSPAPVSSDPGSESGGHCHRLFYLMVFRTTLLVFTRELTAAALLFWLLYFLIFV